MSVSSSPVRGQAKEQGLNYFDVAIDKPLSSGTSHRNFEFNHGGSQAPRESPGLFTGHSEANNKQSSPSRPGFSRKRSLVGEHITKWSHGKQGGTQMAESAQAKDVGTPGSMPSPISMLSDRFSHQTRLQLNSPSPVFGRSAASAVLPHVSANRSSRVRTLKPRDLVSLTERHGRNILLLDFRTAEAHQASRVKTSINVNMPTALAKRSAFTIEEIEKQTPTEAESVRISQWKQAAVIVLYDSDTLKVGDDSPIGKTALKFFDAQDPSKLPCCVEGGFAAITREAPELVESTHKVDSSADTTPSFLKKNKPRLSIKNAGAFSITLPPKQTAANPFFANIRQNMDLIGGVGDPIPVQIPDIDEELKARLPKWIRQFAFEKDGAVQIRDKFLRIEEEEQKRLQDVMSSNSEQYSGAGQNKHSIAAGVERGDKNRYNNIWPYEWSRVRLREDENNTCDYVNASYLHAQNSDKYYIATQGPLAATVKDFWQVVWENNVHVIVMLTRTEEAGQQKCFPYWEAQDFMGPYKLKKTLDQKLMTKYKNHDQETPITIRKFLLSHRDKHLLPAREITHIQYPDWPDFHVVGPESILSLVEEAHNADLDNNSHLMKRRKSIGSQLPSSSNRHPIVTHCSAGCGRTGAFCTIDTVIDLVKQQLENPHEEADDQDLVEQTLRYFRDQRLSVVQTLRQYVLCYDAVLLYTLDHLREQSSAK